MEIKPNDWYPEGLTGEEIKDYYKGKESVLEDATSEGAEYLQVMSSETDRVVIHVSPGSDVEWGPARDAAIMVRDAIMGHNGIDNARIRYDGKDGFYVSGFLAEPTSTDQAREMVEARMGDEVAPRLQSAGIEPNDDLSYIHLDVSSMKDGGSVRAAWSLNADTGLIVADVEETHKGMAELEKEDFTIPHMMALDTSARIGLSGFSRDSYLGVLYPKEIKYGDRLACYATRMNTVEIAATKHMMPTTREAEKWRDSTPRGFVFSFMAPLSVRPSAMHSGGCETMDIFVRRLSVLGDKLGPMVLTIPDGEPYRDGAAAKFFSMLPAGRQYAIDIKSVAWHNAEAYGQMMMRDFALVQAEIDRPPLDTTWSYHRITAVNKDALDRADRLSGTKIVLVKKEDEELRKLLEWMEEKARGRGIPPVEHNFNYFETGPGNSRSPQQYKGTERGNPSQGVEPIENMKPELGVRMPKQQTHPRQDTFDTATHDYDGDPQTKHKDGDTRTKL